MGFGIKRRIKQYFKLYRQASSDKHKIIYDLDEHYKR